MILYIAEKPSLGKAIANALPKPHKQHSGYIETADGNCVTWCIGHLLEQAPPESYDAKFKQWKLEHLPIVPEQWQLIAKKQTSKQLTVVKKLIKQASHLVHAGDPDREGQLLVDEVIAHAKTAKQKISSAQRCLINDLNFSAVKKSLNQLKPNAEFKALSISALARSRADWLYGMNMTRLCTIHGGNNGFNGVLSVGRVQTPLLGLVVARDNEIENFVSKPFYEVLANLTTEQGENFTAKWQPSEHCAPYQDDEGRVLNRQLAENVVKRIEQQTGIITKADTNLKKQTAPLPYNLSSLQIDCAKRFGYSAKQVLDTCQVLYEKHKLITYPRSDCRYLPKDHLKAAKDVVAAIQQNSTALSDAANNADLNLKSKAWNDAKVEAHHAIIPTDRALSANVLNHTELNVYQQIARQYLIQFYPAYQYQEKRIELTIAGGLFKAKSKQTKALGWKALLQKSKTNEENRQAENETKPNEQGEKEGYVHFLPDLKVDQSVQCKQGVILDKQTTPPAHFTDASLLGAMTNIARFVSDASLRKVLKETDGIGTEATRASIIELLFKRQYLTRQGKQIKATSIGQKLISSLPATAITPDMTAIWESRLGKIAKQEFNYQSFMQNLLNEMAQVSQNIAPSSFKVLQGEGVKSAKPRKSYKVKKKRQKGH